FSEPFEVCELFVGGVPVIAEPDMSPNTLGLAALKLISKPLAVQLSTIHFQDRIRRLACRNVRHGDSCRKDRIGESRALPDQEPVGAGLLRGEERPIARRLQFSFALGVHEEPQNPRFLVDRLLVEFRRRFAALFVILGGYDEAYARASRPERD